jgi:aspartate/methionine/tyrosine aminotransferase
VVVGDTETPPGWFQGVKVKGLILINPQNPLGDVYSPEELQDFLRFAMR